MTPKVALLLAGGLCCLVAHGADSGVRNGGGTQPLKGPPIGAPGRLAQYRLEAATPPHDSTVIKFTLGLGAIEQRAGAEYQWLILEATKANGKRFWTWLLSAGYPPEQLRAAESATARYIFAEGDSKPSEFRHLLTHKAVLPQTGAWRHLLPRPWGQGNQSGKAGPFSKHAHYLGLSYTLETIKDELPTPPPQAARVIDLQPDLLIGTASNTRQKDERRRYDNSDYEYVPLSQSDYVEMTRAGINCLKVERQQLPWVEELSAFYWGLGANELPYPESLYRSSYPGPTLFLDEPAVGTRDTVLRPRLAKDEEFRKAITPQVAFQAFQDYFQHELKVGAATGLFNGLKARGDLDLGDLQFVQENLFSWETMVASAAYELSQDPLVPTAMVFEPPGRIGTLRTLPELDMTYGCQLPVDDPKNLTAMIYGFLRGAARLTDKTWGTSVYGALDQSDGFWWLTQAYDLGATRFFFWDNARLACVPYGECLALARNLRAHAANHPFRDLRRLNRAAEVAILLPPGYNLGHVHLGKGSLWGLTELNLERMNHKGVTYRTVMSNFFIEIERCLRLGVAFDLLWDLPELDQGVKWASQSRALRNDDYREVVRIREDGKVEVAKNAKTSLFKTGRVPLRPEGMPPKLAVELSATKGKAPLEIIARAAIQEGATPVFYTYGADSEGMYRNAMVSWELYGPGDEDYRCLIPGDLKPKVTTNGNRSQVTVGFTLTRPGAYRLRTATVDLAGRTTTLWTPITVVAASRQSAASIRPNMRRSHEPPLQRFRF